MPQSLLVYISWTEIASLGEGTYLLNHQADDFLVGGLHTHTTDVTHVADGLGGVLTEDTGALGIGLAPQCQRMGEQSRIQRRAQKEA